MPVVVTLLATEVISQEIQIQSEIGIKAQEILLRGEAIPEEMAAKMLEDKINSPEVAHHGRFSCRLQQLIHVLSFTQLFRLYLSVRNVII